MQLSKSWPRRLASLLLSSSILLAAGSQLVLAHPANTLAAKPSPAPSGVPAVTPAASAAPTVKAQKTIRVAVLRFNAPENDPQLQNYAQGATQTLIDALSHVPNFAVVHQVWVDTALADHGIKFAEGGNLEQEVAIQVGNWLEAQDLITGYLLRSGNQVRMTANVIDLVTGKTEVEQLTGPLDKIFDLMDNLAHRVLTSQKVVLTPQLRQRLAQEVRPTAHLSAYEYYIHGKHAYLLDTPIGFKDAIDWYDKAVAQDPNFAQAYAGLADAYSSWGWQRQTNSQESKSYFEKALENALKSVKLGPDLLETHRALAHVYQNMGRMSEAEAQVNLALAINLHDAQALYTLWKLTAPDNPEDPNLLSALALDPGLLAAHNDRGIAYDNKGDFDSAIREYQMVLKVAPRKGNTMYNLALIYKKQNKLDDALSLFRQASEIMPEDPDSQYQLGAVYRNRKQISESVVALQKALSLDPKYTDAYLMLGRIYLDQNQADRALDELNKARRIKDDDPEVHELLGDALSRKGQNDAAIKAYERSLQLDPGKDNAERLRTRIQELKKVKGNLTGA